MDYYFRLAARVILYAVLLGDFSDPNFLDCLPRGLIIVQFLGPFHHRDLVFLQELSGYLWSVTRITIMHEDCAAVDVLGSIPSGVRRNEMQTSSATTRYETPISLGVSLWLQQWFLTLLEVLNPTSFISAFTEPFVISLKHRYTFY